MKLHNSDATAPPYHVILSHRRRIWVASIMQRCSHPMASGRHGAQPGMLHSVQHDNFAQAVTHFWPHFRAISFSSCCGNSICHSRGRVCCRTTLFVLEIATACKAGLAMTLKSSLSSLRGAKRRSNLLFSNKPGSGNPAFSLWTPALGSRKAGSLAGVTSSVFVFRNRY